MAHQAEPVTRTLTVKTKPITATAKIPIQVSPSLPVWMTAKSVEATQAACQKLEPLASFRWSSRQGMRPRPAKI